jgi:putative ABC transport system permease protein
VTTTDVLKFAAGSVLGYRVRTLLTLLAMGIGVASVIVLTALGEGARRFVTGEFQSLGTHLLIVLPGRSETTGGPPPLFGETPRDLTLDDALALAHSRAVRRIAPIAVGSAGVSYREREREVMIIGSTAAFLDVRHLKMASGRFFSTGDPRRASPLCVLGAKLKHELFGAGPAIGHWVRIGDRRFRVVGTLASEGRSIGLDLQDIAIVPVAAAQALFDSYSLFRVLVEARSDEAIPRARRDILRIIRQRHEGEDDVTVISQDAVVATFDKIFTALTLTVVGIASISLAVAGILIMNVMLVAVSQRTAEVGLLKALGASSGSIMRVFLAEATILSLVGAAVGVAVGYAAIRLVDRVYPLLPLNMPPWAVAAAVFVAMTTGLLFGVLPARRAAKLDPVAALAGR